MSRPTPLRFAPPLPRGVEVGPLGTMEATCNAYGCKQTHGREIRIGVHVTRLCDEHLAALRRQLRA